MGKTSGGDAATTADRPGSRLELLESKLRPPQLRSAAVSRTTLLETLETPGVPPIVSISAPPGYGKTTLLAQWASRSRRAFAWVSLDDLDNDPVVLLGNIARALDRVSPLDPAIFDDLVSGASVATVLSRLGAALAGMEHSFVLVLDDLHALTNQQSLDAIDGLVDLMPPGSQLVLCGRAESPGRLSALRAQGLVREIGPDALRMNESQAEELLRAADVELSDNQLAALVEHTEGWPAGLYLAALAIRGGDGRRLKDPSAFRGDDRFVADYLRCRAPPEPPREGDSLPDQDRGPGAYVRAALRRCARISGFGGDPRLARAFQPLCGRVGSHRVLVPLSPSLPGAAAGRARTSRARTDSRPLRPSRDLV